MAEALHHQPDGTRCWPLVGTPWLTVGHEEKGQKFDFFQKSSKIVKFEKLKAPWGLACPKNNKKQVFGEKIDT